jgi:hypothetical protein
MIHTAIKLYIHSFTYSPAYFFNCVKVLENEVNLLF